MIDELGNVSTVIYDAANNRILQIDPDYGLTIYSYNPTNQLLSETRYGSNAYVPYTSTIRSATGLTATAANGHIATNSYNAANALILSVPNAGQTAHWLSQRLRQQPVLGLRYDWHHWSELDFGRGLGYIYFLYGGQWGILPAGKLHRDRVDTEERWYDNFIGT